MHVGREYPYLADLWAVSSVFWPGFVPRHLTILFGMNDGTYWGPLTGFDAISGVGVPSTNREVVTYSFDGLPAGVGVLECILYTAFPDGIKAHGWGIYVSGDAFYSPAVAWGLENAPTEVGPRSDWPFGTSVGPDPYVEPSVVLAPTLWADVP